MFLAGKGAKFPILGKIDCETGDATAPLYKYMKSVQKGPLGVESLAWNFGE